MLTVNVPMMARMSLGVDVAMELLTDAFRSRTRSKSTIEGSVTKGPLQFEVKRVATAEPYCGHAAMLLENNNLPVYCVTMRFKGAFVCKSRFTEEDA